MDAVLRKRAPHLRVAVAGSFSSLTGSFSSQTGSFSSPSSLSPKTPRTLESSPRSPSPSAGSFSDSPKRVLDATGRKPTDHEQVRRTNRTGAPSALVRARAHAPGLAAPTAPLRPSSAVSVSASDCGAPVLPPPR